MIASDRQPTLPCDPPFELATPAPPITQRNRMMVRQWTMLRLLLTTDGQPRQTIEALAFELGVTTRTVRRDLDALQEAHFPIISRTRGDRRYWGSLAWR